MIILSIVTFILVFGLLVFVHEIGHFLAAKKAGVKVEEFGFGYPPRIFAFKKKGTTYSLNLIPLGGFVKMLGQDDFDVNAAVRVQRIKNGNFNYQSVSKRALILLAGVGMNFLFAAVLIMIGLGIGMPVVSDKLDRFKGAEVKTKVIIMEVDQSSPGEKAGLLSGDLIETIDGHKVTSHAFLQDYVKEHQGRKINLAVQRDNQDHKFSLILKKQQNGDEGLIGIGVEDSTIVKYPWYRAIIVGAKETVHLTWLVMKALYSFFKGIFVSFHLADEATGPIGIARMSGQVTQLGFVYLIQFVALLSLNLAILNILPFPALDGGHLLFLGIEKIRRKPVTMKIENIIHLVGFGLLIILLIAISYKDILRFF